MEWRRPALVGGLALSASLIAYSNIRDPIKRDKPQLAVTAPINDTPKPAPHSKLTLLLKTVSVNLEEETSPSLLKLPAEGHIARLTQSLNESNLTPLLRGLSAHPEKKAFPSPLEIPADEELRTSGESTAQVIEAIKWNARHNTVREDLPSFTREEVRMHDTIEKKVWITYGIGVYDVTEFIPHHPGSSDKISIAAGGSVDSFWQTYQQHNTEAVLDLLDTFRIGNLRKADGIHEEEDSMFDIWANEPKRSEQLQIVCERPFNAETLNELLPKKFVTPADIFYVRNHLPVPDVDTEDFRLEIVTGSAVTGSDVTELSLEDLKKFPSHEITAAIICGGNRRSEMNVIRPVRGLSWKAGAIGNGVWKGALLKDVLESLGVVSDDKRHVHFEGLDVDPTATPYAASIPLCQAMDARGDVILAYEMNGLQLSADHGKPLRVVVPGTVGARSVKWLGRIVVATEESDSHWQQNDYKAFSPTTDWDTVDFTSAPAMQAIPVTSAICTPREGAEVEAKDGYAYVTGYAFAGGGHKIIRVDVTADKGKSWVVAELEDESPKPAFNRHWSWSLWKAKIQVPPGTESLEVWSKAVDSNYNSQPESFENIWNLRGVCCNAYSRVRFNIKTI